MTFHRRLRRSIAALAVAATAAVVAVPIAAAADPGRYVQIGGELVLPAQLSSWQAHAGQASARPRLVQIGGAPVAPKRRLIAPVALRCSIHTFSNCMRAI